MEAVLSWIIINTPFLLAVVLLIFICARAVKEGFISELFSFISALIASVAILLLAMAVHGVFTDKKIALVIAIVLLILLAIFRSLINLLFGSLKLVAKLPGVSIANKLLGIAMAVVETVLIIWAIYCIIIIVDAGILGDWIRRCVSQNPLLKMLYEYNYLYKIVASLSDKIRGIDIWNSLGI